MTNIHPADGSNQLLAESLGLRPDAGLVVIRRRQAVDDREWIIEIGLRFAGVRAGAPLIDGFENARRCFTRSARARRPGRPARFWHDPRVGGNRGRKQKGRRSFPSVGRGLVAGGGFEPPTFGL